MKRINTVWFLAGILVTILGISCDMGNETNNAGSKAKPWAGQKIKEMYQGTTNTGADNFLRSDVGKTHWYYIEAIEEMTYEIGFSLPILLVDQVKDYAMAPMTCYKEDGTIIIADKKPIGRPIYYYSSSNQRLHISFKFEKTGWIAFYYDEHEDYNEYEEGTEYY